MIELLILAMLSLPPLDAPAKPAGVLHVIVDSNCKPLDTEAVRLNNGAVARIVSVSVVCQFEGGETMLQQRGWE